MSEQPPVKLGQIWVEIDPREERYVLVESVWPGSQQAIVRRVLADGSAWPKSRALPVALRRFNGKRTGYAIHRDVP